MGSRHSKFEDPITVNTDLDDMHTLDPRSPNICRTPLNVILEKQRRQNPVQDIHNQPSSSNQFVMDNMPSCNLFKKKFFKGFSYHLNDPRSPSLLLNRTPILFEDEKSFNMDDTFSDLFIEKSEHCPEVTTNNDLLKNKEDEIVKPEIQNTNVTPQVNNASVKNKETIVEVLQKDPRSPSIGVERTPIILSDDTPDEDFLIESVLEKLSFEESQRKPQNKPLERIKNNKGVINNRRNSKNNIYEDDDQVFSTPKSRNNSERAIVCHNSNQSKRTPLRCVANKSFGRSKSVENSEKSKKNKLPLTSLDDNNLGAAKFQKKIFFGIENEENSLEVW